MGAASVRAGNVLGGGDWAEDRLLPDCIRALVSGENINIRNPHSLRPWQFVLEPLSGYLWLAAMLWDYPGEYSGAWNFGPNQGSEMEVGELVNSVIELWGSGQWSDISQNENTFREAEILRLCCDKAKAKLNWSNTYEIDDCLKCTIEWYKAYYHSKGSKDMYDVCKGQIQEYIDRAKMKKIDWAC